MVDATLRNLKHALRRMRNEPGFTALALLTLALGIGANSAIFSIVDGVLLEPLPYHEPDRLVALWEVNEAGRTVAVSSPNFRDWGAQSDAFSAMTLHTRAGATTVLGGSEPARAAGAAVSRGFFDVLGVPAARGRTFLAEESQAGADPAVVISTALWQQLLGSSEGLAEHKLEINATAHRVVGVMPTGFDIPHGAEFWTPYELIPDESSRTAHNYRVLARLAESTSLDRARAEMTTLASHLQARHAGDNDAIDVAVNTLPGEVIGSTRRPLLLLLGAAGIVLLVACANLSGTLLARAVSRQREMAIRAALGAGLGGVFRQLLTEAVLLASLGGLLGLGVALALLDGLRRVATAQLPRLENIALDGTVLMVTLAVSTLVGLLCGLMPAWAATRTDLTASLAAGGKGDTGGGRAWAWNLLVGAEVGLALILLVGAGLLIRSVWGLLQAPAGFEAAGVVTLDLTAPIDMTGETQPLRAAEAELVRFYDRLFADLDTIPGIARRALIDSPPLAGLSTTLFYFADRPEDEHGQAGYAVVSEDYFETLGIPLLAGRGIDADDTADRPHVTVISKAMAERYWPAGDALGKQIRPPGMDWLHGETWLTVVGVVNDVRHRSLAQAPIPEMYVSLRQRGVRARYASIVAKTEADPAVLATAISRLLRAHYPDMPVALSTLEGAMWASIARTRFSTTVLLAFAILATVLAATGIWGVVSYQVTQRRREVGIRMALGASPRDVLAAVVGGSFKVILAGAAVGVLGAYGLTRLLANQLYEIEPTDPATFAAMLAVLLVAGLVASALPASRAARIDPIATLRD